MNAPMSYRLNPQNARVPGSSMNIDEKGAYRGIFTRAEAVTSRKGTQGIEFDFKSVDGSMAKFLTVWASNEKGEELHGRKIIDSILVALGQNGIEAADATIMKYDNEQRKEVSTRATIFPKLMGQPVGVVLNREEYLSNSNEHKWKNSLVCGFEAQTGRLASERLDKATPDKTVGLERLLTMLRDKPLKAGSNTGRLPPQDGGGSPRTGGSGFDDMDDDIPF